MVKGLAKTIQMIAWFDENGKINPIKFKYEEENEGTKMCIRDRRCIMLIHKEILQ